MMRLVCPSCGAIHSGDAWVNDINARQALAVLVEMPAGMGPRCLPYMALFRPATGGALQWRKVSRLLTELRDLAVSPHVQWEKNPARPSGPHIWVAALDRILDTPPARLPLKSHGYLTSIAYDLADVADRRNEVERNKSERFGGPRAKESGTAEPAPAMTMEQMQSIRKKNLGRKQ